MSIRKLSTIGSIDKALLSNVAAFAEVGKLRESARRWSHL